MPAIALHAERTADPAVVRWVVRSFDPDGHDVTFERADARPGTIAGAITAVSPDVAGVRLAPGLVEVRLAVGAAWDHVAGAVERALREALAAGLPAGCELPAASIVASLAELTAAVDRRIGPIAAAHGGRIEVVELRDGTLVLHLHGACSGCPGAPSSLAAIREATVGAHLPGVRDVVVERAGDHDGEGSGILARLRVRHRAAP